MNEYLTLLKVNLKQTYSLPKEGKERKKAIRTYIGMTCGLLPLLILVCVLLYFVVSMLGSNTTMLTELVGGAFTGVQMMVLIYGIITYMSVMFFSKDNDLLMSLPIKTTSIYLSKFTVVYLSHLFMSVITIFPLVLVVGIAAKITSVAYYLIGLISMFIVPIVSLCVISIIALPIAYVVKFMRKHRALGVIVTLALFIGAFIAYFMLIMQLSNFSDPNQAGGDIVLGAFNVFKVLSMIMYPNVILASAMFGMGISILTNFLIYFAIIVVLGAISLGLSVLLYKKAVPMFSESGVAKVKAYKVTKDSSKVGLLIKMELKDFSRDISAAINYAIGMFLTPIIVSMLLFTSLKSLPDIMQIMNSLNLVIILGAGANYLALLPISREGKRFALTKTLPISQKEYIKSKVIIANSYSTIIALIVAIIFLIKGFNLLAIAIYIVDTVLLLAGINALSMTRDFANPNTTWTNNKELFKQNTKIFAPMMISLGVMIVLIGLTTAYGYMVAGSSEMMANVIFWLVYTAMAVGIFLGFNINFYKRNMARLSCIERG